MPSSPLPDPPPHGAPLATAALRAEQDRWVEELRLIELGRLAAEMIHELRQPVFALRAVVQLHQAGIVARDLDPFETINGQSGSLEQLINRYAALCSRPLEYGQPTGVRRALESAVQALGARSRARGRPLHFSSRGADSVVMIDPVGLSSAALHLLSAGLERCASEVTAHQSGPGFVVELDGPAGDEADLSEAFGERLPTGAVARSIYAARLLVERGQGVLRWEPHLGGERLVVELPPLGDPDHG